MATLARGLYAPNGHELLEAAQPWSSAGRHARRSERRHHGAQERVLRDEGREDRPKWL